MAKLFGAVLCAALLATVLVTPAAAQRRAPVRTTTEGFAYVADNGDRAGSGRLRTYRIEVEPAADVNLRWVTMHAERALGDRRGWTGAADWALRRVRRRPDIRVLIATPRTVDRLCARAGLRTMGRLSCWNGQFAAINVNRWRRGSAGFTGPLRTYRRYVLNHEVGHGLGYDHRSCPRPGARAPVMQQQTIVTRPCRANGWPALDP
ncbi:MAG TPA: DUF3152 domain-containing protein [Euzebyales bacterium]